MLISMVAATMLAAPPATAHRCTGDCDASDTIAVSELVVGVRIALGQIALDICPPFDADLNNRISINELQVAVNNVFSYCGHGSPPTPTSTRTPTRSPTPVEENSPGPTASPTATASAIEVVPSL